jgi:tetratricopeptide (TPR) repeat protein
MSKEVERVMNVFNDGKFEDALKLIIDFEKVGDLNPEDKHYFRFMKGNILIHMGRLQESLGLAEQDYQESKTQNKPLFVIDSIYLKWVNFFIQGRGGEARKDVKLCEKLLKSASQEPSLEVKLREGFFYFIRGSFFFWEQNYEKAIEFQKKSLDILEKYNFATILIPSILSSLGHTYTNKGELELALSYHIQSIEIYSRFTKSNIKKMGLASSYESIGSINYQQGKLDIAVEYFRKSMKIFDQLSSPMYKCIVYYNLIKTLLAKKSLERAKEILQQFHQYNENNSTPTNNSFYNLSKALILKSSTRTRDRAEAEEELKKIIKRYKYVIKSGRRGAGWDFTEAVSILCSLYLHELKITNDMTILNDINPLVGSLMKESERTSSYSLQAHTLLLRGKIALLQMNMGDARSHLTQAQRVAEEHNLQLLAREISTEHDRLLEQLDKWEEFKKSNASISERMALASLEESVELIQRKRAINAPELINEEPVLLLILAGGGILLFSYPFTDEVKVDDELFAGFLSAFTTFSDEALSEGLDRAKFGQYRVLMKNIADYSICYLFKGQSYLAQKKLSDFTENFQKNTSMMQTLDKFNQTSQVIELNNFPFLEGFIKGIFTSN